MGPVIPLDMLPPCALVRSLSRSLGLLLALCLVASGAAASTSPERPSGPVARRLLDRAAAGERIRVIVELDEASVPEGWLPGPEARMAQRVRVAGAQSRLLETLAGSDASRIRPYPSIPFVALEVGARSLARIASDPAVRSIREDRPARPSLDKSVPHIQGDLAHAIGFDGSGQVVVVLDTGVDAGHQNLAGQVVAEACFASGYGPSPASGDCPNGNESQVGVGSAVPCDYADECKHGTHVAGIAMGDGPQYPGVAPGAGVVAIQVFSEFPGSLCEGGVPCAQSWSSDQDLALLHVFNDLAGSYDIAAVNMSLGGDVYSDPAACDADRPGTKAAIDQLRSIGIATVISSGNYGCGSSGCTDAISSPSCISSAVSVGATRLSDDRPPGWGNNAPFMSLWAPGQGIDAPLYGTTNQYVRLNGTSMAAPHVAGAFAIVGQAVPGVSVDAALSAFQSTGIPVPNGQGVKQVEIRDALSALGITECIDGIDNDGDGLADGDDPGCESSDDPDETRPELVCDNGLDDDADGLVDTADPGCRDPEWLLEDPQCQDGIDNDEDGEIDFDGSPPDSNCEGPWDGSEAPSRCGLGAELGVAVVLLLGLRRRRARRHAPGR